MINSFINWLDWSGSVSMMNRICYDAVTRKKSRLEALAASRERNLGSGTKQVYFKKASKIIFFLCVFKSYPGYETLKTKKGKKPDRKNAKF